MVRLAFYMKEIAGVAKRSCIYRTKQSWYLGEGSFTHFHDSGKHPKPS